MWAKSNSYVLKPGEPGDWDQWCYFPSVIRDGDIFRMWYTGYDGIYANIGMATSTDGINWIKYGMPLLGGYAPSVLKDDDNIYKIWYISHGDLVNYAESNDGIQWITYGPVEFIEFGIFFPSVLKYNDLYYMWYGGNGIGFATSTNGQAWIDLGTVLSSTPDSKDSCGVNDPSVLLINNTWHMWYQGWDTPNEENIFICHATSLDGASWIKDNNYLLPLGDNDAWDSCHVWSPHVIVDGDMLRMWYTGWKDYETGRQIGYADMPLILGS